MTSANVSLREATADDAAGLHALIVAIATHQRQQEFVRATVESLLRDGFGPDPKFSAIVAESKGALVGYLSYTWNYSIWLGSTYMNIDDVFVTESHRGLGVGEALMHRAMQLCRERGYPRVRWEVQSDNAGAIRFYERLGARLRTKGVFVWDV